MTATPTQALAAKQKEMLLVMITLSFIEDNGLMSSSQLSAAKKSLQALFIRTSGEETMLRKLIEMLKVNHDIHEAFSAISKVSIRISTGAETISRKLSYVGQYVGSLPLTPEENSEFFAPFTTFTQNFRSEIIKFNHCIESYLSLREAEAKRAQELLIAKEASERLKNRLSGSLASDTHGEVERNIKNEVITNFDYAGTLGKLQDAQRESKRAAREIERILLNLKSMCQMAMNPQMRDKADSMEPTTQYYDIFTHFAVALTRFPRIDSIKDFIVEYFKLYQRAYGMFALDFDNLNKAVDAISKNPDEYFGAKDEDADIKGKRDKLKKYEGLIPFLESAHANMAGGQDAPFGKFSKQISELMTTGDARWAHISESLLMAKVAAEADLTTRLNAA